jgi:formate hydrogenlyase transcriptional activator
VPPLRERREDIPDLMRHYLQWYNRVHGRAIKSFTFEATKALLHYHYPGNIRELQNLIERAVILSRGPVLEVPQAELKPTKPENGALNSSTLEAVEREHILRILRDSNWVIGGPAGAAARLGLNRTTLNNRLRKLGITRPRQ